MNALRLESRKYIHVYIAVYTRKYTQKVGCYVLVTETVEYAVAPIAVVTS